MIRSASVPALGSEFDNFLFAPIGEEKNGMLLSVLSALARLNVDPWQEAAKLAQLPNVTATERLTSLIAALPDGPSAQRDPETIAARLIALLPRQAGSNIPSPGTALGSGAASNFPAAIYVISMAVVLGVLFIIGNHLPPAQIGKAYAPVPSAAIAQLPPPSSGPAATK